MIAELAKILPSFSEVGHTRCFLHIVNLVAKSIIKQFDVQKKREDQHLDDAEQELRGDVAERELQDLAGDVDLEERQSIAAMAQCQIDGETGETDMEMETDDDVEGWIDEMMLLSPAEREQVEGDIRPVKLVLVKVRYQLFREDVTHRNWKLRKITFKVVNSSTIVLPSWRKLLQELKASDRIMPRDVTTRWNSTYDMLKFALEYRKAIDILTADRQNELRNYELSEREWTIAAQLSDVLKVSDVSDPRITDSSSM
jgi:hypothetical protein